MNQRTQNFVTVCVALLLWVVLQGFCVRILGMSFSKNMVFLVFLMPALVSAVTYTQLQGVPATRFFCILAMLPGPAVVFIGLMAFMSMGNVIDILWAVGISLGESIAAIIGAMITVVFLAYYARITPAQPAAKPAMSKTKILAQDEKPVKQSKPAIKI